MMSQIYHYDAIAIAEFFFCDVFVWNNFNILIKSNFVFVVIIIRRVISSLDWNDKTFKEYLTHKGLTPNLIHYVLFAIAGGTNSMLCLDGVRECKKFLMSLGRYGNTPFLWPMYGSGDLPQCFCR